MHILAVANQKGGCGKTTTAINLSAALAQFGKKVLLVDFDPQAHASSGLNVESSKSMYNVLSNLCKDKSRLSEIILNINRNFDLVPSNILLGTLEQELAEEISRESRLKDQLDSLSASYDYAIIDCPPNLGILTINAIRAAEEVIVPSESSRFSLIGVEQLLDIIELVRNRLNHSVRHRILVTIFDSRLRHSFDMLDLAKKKFSDKLFNTIVHINVKLKEAAVNGLSVISYDKYSRGSKDYLSLARELNHNYFGEATLEKQVRKIVKEKTKDFITQAFSLKVAEAEHVYIVGDFNNWSIASAIPLKKENGRWSTQVPLKSGKYRYRFIVDGKWVEDPSNSDLEKNPFGSFDSVVDVK